MITGIFLHEGVLGSLGSCNRARGCTQGGEERNGAGVLSKDPEGPDIDPLMYLY